MTDRLHMIKEMLLGCIEGQMAHLDEVDTEELGDVIDMVKDLEEAIYYCTVVEAMEKPSEYVFGKQHEEDNIERRKYYSDGGRHSSYTAMDHSMHEIKDTREGRSPRSRRSYLESKEAHQDKAYQMRELEKYMQELTQDIVEMIDGASSEEKQYLSKKINALSTKIGQLSD